MKPVLNKLYYSFKLGSLDKQIWLIYRVKLNTANYED